MAYRLKRGESVAEGVKRIVSEETGAAIEHLRGARRAGMDEAVHEVRKSIKKIRALLRLVRPELGDVFDEENLRLRDAGQKLSEVRDAVAVIGVFDQLRSKKLPAGAAAPIRRHLMMHKKHVEAELGARKVMDGVVEVLGQVPRSLKRRSMDLKGFAAIEPGFEEAFRKGKKALATAQKSGAREDFHEWRKRVKDHWYHVRLLEKLWSDVLEGYEHSLKDLEDALGEDLNLAILRERVLADAGAAGDGLAVDRVIEAIDQSRQELRKRALEIGARVYSEKPRQFTRQIGRLWKAWR